MEHLVLRRIVPLRVLTKSAIRIGGILRQENGDSPLISADNADTGPNERPQASGNGVPGSSLFPTSVS